MYFHSWTLVADKENYVTDSWILASISGPYTLFGLYKEDFLLGFDT